MIKTVRIGIVGCGMISHRHMRIYKHMNEISEKLGFRAEIVACAEVIPERLKAWGDQYGIAEADRYLDFHDMLKREDIDCLDICVHTNYHTPVTIECMKAGFDCYCEKPAASTYADAKLLYDASKKLGRKLHLQMSSVMTPQARIAREYVQSGKIGTPYLVNHDHLIQRRRPGYDLKDFPEAFLSKKIAGHGQSVDLGVYILGHLLFILGNPKVSSVYGMAGQFIYQDPAKVSIEGGFDVDDTINGMVKFENGLALNYTNTSANNLKNNITSYILGTDGAIEFTGTDMAGYKLARNNPTDGAGFFGEPEVIYHSVDGEKVVDVGPLNCDAQGVAEIAADPKMQYYYDNQCMWLAYKLGILSEEERYDNMALALNQLIITDGMFLSQEWGRSVTYDEIIANSPSYYVREQEINGKMYTYDVSF